MEHYVGIDVSLELSSVCIVDGGGKIVLEAKVESHPDAIAAFLRKLLRLYSRYGPLDCSTARGGLCHEASARPIARPSHSSATRSIDNSLGGPRSFRQSPSEPS